jgi:2-aminobenzoate-CoA ligase
VAAPGYVVRAIDPEKDAGLRELTAGTPGQLAVRGPTGLTYWRMPHQQVIDVREGWTLQDDMIVLDDSGIAEYLGRTDFLISTAGNKVAPAEVENVLADHPAVKECLVIGLPDQLRQEIVAAFVVLHDDGLAGDDLVRGLQDLVKQRLAPYKYPRHVEFIGALPRDHVGKVQPKVMREQVLARLALAGGER